MAEIRTESMVRRNPRAIYRKMGEDSGGVILHLDSAAYHSVNATGSLIWDLLESEKTFEDLVAELKQRQPDFPSDIEADVAEFIGELRERDLIELG
jgi:hypothetical protein